MRISKHIHSCLLIEEADKTILIDPGIFSYEAKALDINKLNKLDFILITHEHPDHMHIPFIKELLEKFPTTPIISNESVVSLLEKENIRTLTHGTLDIHITLINHERVFDRPSPKNVLFEIFGKLTHPGDAMSFTETKDILALPLLGPSWMITQAAEKAVSLKPKYIIPIHDWHWRDGFRKEYYKRLEIFFNPLSIQFKGLETGEVIEV